MRRALLFLVPHLFVLGLIPAARALVAVRPPEPVDAKAVELHVQEVLKDCEAQLWQRVEGAAREPGLAAALKEAGEEGGASPARQEAFRLLRKRLRGFGPDDAGLALLDAHLQPVAWAGRTLRMREGFLSRETPSRRGLHLQCTSYWYLVSARCLRDDGPEGGAVVGFLTLEADFPFKNRYIERKSILEEAVGIPGVALRLGSGGEAPFTVDASGAREAEEAADSKESEKRRAAWTAGALLLWLGVLAAQLGRSKANRAMRAGVGAVAVLAARVAASAMGVLAPLLPGRLTETGMYANPFASELAGRTRGLSFLLDRVAPRLDALAQSPADLLLSLLALLAMVLLLCWGLAPPASAPRSPLRFASMLALPVAWYLALRGVFALSSSAVQDGMASLFRLEGNLLGQLRCAIDAALLCAAVAALSLVTLAARWVTWGTAEWPRWILVAFYSVCVFALVPGGLPLEGTVLVAVALLLPALAPLLDRGALARALLPLCCALLVFPPLEQAQERDQRSLVEQRGSELTDSADEALAEAALDQGIRSFASVPSLREALEQKPAPERDQPLALTLWLESDLARKGEDCYIAVRREGNLSLISDFSFNLSRAWLPDNPFDAKAEEEVLPPGDIPFRRMTVTGAEGKPLGEVLLAVLPRYRAAEAAMRAALLRVDPRIEKRIERAAVTVYKGGRAVSSMREAASGSQAGAPPLLPPEVRQEFSTREHVFQEERVGNAEWQTLYVAREGGAGLAFAISRRLPLPFERFETFLHLFLLFGVGICAVGLVALGVRAVMRRAQLSAVLGRLQVQLFSAFVLLGLLPIISLAVVHQRLRTEEAKSDADADLRAELAVAARECTHRLEDDILPKAKPGSMEFLLGENARELAKWSAQVAGHDVVLYVGGREKGSTRPELFDLLLLPQEMEEEAYEEVLLRGREAHIVTRPVGGFALRIGYQRVVGGPQHRPYGVLAIPELDTSSGGAGAFDSTVLLVFGIYGLVLTAVWLGSAALSRRIAAPVEAMTLATRRAAGGDLSGRVSARATGELAGLVESFNRMLEDLETGREALAKAEREAAWRGMARQIAHEIKNPLTPLKLSAQHLARAYADGAPEFGKLLTDCVEMIVQQVDLLGRIASDFSYFAKLPDRRPQEVDLNELLRGVTQLFGSAVEGRIEVRLSLAASMPHLWLDADEWRRVWTNLVKNAIEAMEGKGTLTVETERGQTQAPSRGTGRKGGRTEVAASRPWVEVRIRDTGGGVPEEVREKLFQPYITTKSQGTGLGLAICKKSIDDAGGTITLEGTPGAGTTVRVRIPFGPGTPVALPETRE